MLGGGYQGSQDPDGRLRDCCHLVTWICSKSESKWTLLIQDLHLSRVSWRIQTTTNDCVTGSTSIQASNNRSDDLRTVNSSSIRLILSYTAPLKIEAIRNYGYANMYRKEHATICVAAHKTNIGF